ACVPKEPVNHHPNRIHRARQAGAGRRAEGGRRRRDARMEGLGGKGRLVRRAVEAERHDHRPAERTADRRHAQGRQRHAGRMAAQGGARGEEDHRPVPRPPVVRAALDRLYDAAAYLAAFFLVGTLAMVLLGIIGRLVNWFIPGTDSYAGYCMAACGFLALAHTLKRGEHIRVSLVLEHAGVRVRRGLELWALAAASVLAAAFAWYSVRLAVQ